MSLPSDLLNFRMQVVLERLGKKVTNPLRFREELGSVCPTDEEILAEDIIYLQEEAEKQHDREVEKQKEAAYSAWVANGFDTGLGYKLRVADSDQSKYANLVTGNLLENTPDSQVFDIEALDDTKIKLTWGELKPILVAYKNYCYASWKASKGIQ